MLSSHGSALLPLLWQHNRLHLKTTCGLRCSRMEKTRKNSNKDKQDVFSSSLSARKPLLPSSNQRESAPPGAPLSTPMPLPSFKLHWVQPTGSQREERILVVYLLICNTLNSPSSFITSQEKLAFPKDGIFTSWITESFVFACLCFLVFKVKFLL